MHLEDILKEMGKICIAYSGGADSAFLLWKAVTILGSSNVRAIMVVNSAVPAIQRKWAMSLARDIGVRVEVVEIPLDEIPGFRENPENRCALCKRAMYEKVIALSGGWPVCDGATITDRERGLIGLKVADTLGVRHPLMEAGLTDDDVRRMAESVLPVEDISGTTCLATRFPHGHALNDDELALVERAEEILIDMGFHLVRVRMYGHPVIQVKETEIEDLVKRRREILQAMHEIGLNEVFLDLRGYVRS